ncbi:hypothetical protein BT69DRAFT_1290259 [Atractiella rhizophila]|nr:hypothetical protein BT69DRAFT_1290259 [Atractiella rhizophila]
MVFFAHSLLAVRLLISARIHFTFHAYLVVWLTSFGCRASGMETFVFVFLRVVCSDHFARKMQCSRI